MKKIINVVSGVYRNSNIVAKSALGSWVTDINSRRYLDMTSGIGALSTGHSHPVVVDAVKQQVGQLVHAQQNCLLTHPPQQQLIENLRDVCPRHLDNYYFTNSGSEAVENAIKIARISTGKPNIISFRGGFHGRTIGCMSLSSSKVSCKKGVSPLMPGVYQVRYPTLGLGDEVFRELQDLLLRATAPEETAAIILEPVLGEGGVIKADPIFVQKMKSLCQQHNILWISDEVQTGMGRTGYWWGYEHFKCEPDMITFGKGIASGFPLAGVAANDKLFQTIHDNGLGGTYNGNVLSTVAANATFEVFRGEKLLSQSENMGNLLRDEIIKLHHPLVTEVRNYGLMVAIELNLPGDKFRALVLEAQLHGLILLTTGIGSSIRLLPPLNLTEDDLEIFLVKFNRLLNNYLGQETSQEIIYL